jgi:hypothetical protein
MFPPAGFYCSGKEPRSGPRSATVQKPIGLLSFRDGLARTASGVRCGARAHSSPATLLGGRIQGGPTIFADAAFVLYSGAL